MSTDPRSTPPQTDGETGVLLAAANGPAIRYDASGVVLNLSDTVVADLARRLPAAALSRLVAGFAGVPGLEALARAAVAIPAQGEAAAAPSATRAVPAPAPSAAGPEEGGVAQALAGQPGARLSGTATATEAGSGSAPGAVPDPGVLGDIDAWDLSEANGFYRFTARMPGRAGEARRYLRDIRGGAVLAETGGAVQAILSYGGGRLLTSFAGEPDFPQHIVSLAKADRGEPQRLASRLRHHSGSSLLGDALLGPRYEARRALPLMPVFEGLAPPGYDPRPGIGEVLEAFERCAGLAAALGRPARVLALRLDPGCDQAPAEAGPFAALLRDLLDQLVGGLEARGSGSFPVLLCPDPGAWWQGGDPGLRVVAEALHELIQRPGAHRLLVPAPGYVFEQDALGQPVPGVLQQRAALEALALEAYGRGEEWLCPLLSLAERSGDVIRATFRATGPLVIDPADPFRAGAAAGFALRGTGAEIASVSLAEDDPGALLIRLSGTLAPDSSGQPLRLDLAFGSGEGIAPPGPSGPWYPPARASVRDSWSAPGPAGRLLCRWALPASVLVH